MRGNEFLDKMELVSPEYVASADMSKSIKRVSLVRWGIAAACLCLVIAAALGYMKLYSKPTVDILPTEQTGAETIQLYAAEVGNVFSSSEKDGLSAYTTIYAPDLDSLGLSVPPVSEYIKVYSRSKTTADRSLGEEFFSKNLDAMRSVCGITSSEYKITEYTAANGNTGYSADIVEADENDFSMVGFMACGNDMQIFTSCNIPIKINGTAPSLLRTDTDEQIAEKLAGVTEYLNSLFGKNYTELKAVKVFRPDQLGSIDVYLYNSASSTLPAELSESPLANEFIKLTFNTDWGDGTAYHWNGSANEAFLTRIELQQKPCLPDKEYTEYGLSKLLTLEEAEKMLNKGYVFGGQYSAPDSLNQKEVDFTDYDGVYFEYLSGNNGLAVPFYTFYKCIRQSNVGVSEYAKVYVCAVEMTGIEEYFNSQVKARYDFDSDGEVILNTDQK